MSLEKELEGVTVSDIESPDDVTDHEEEVEDQDLEVADDEEDQDGDDAGDGEKPGRPAENVRRELLRKQDELEKRFSGQFNQLFGLVKSLIESKTDGKKPGAPDPNDMSADQLEALRDQVPEESRVKFDALLVEKRIDEKVSAKLTQHQEEQKYREERSRANRLAVDRFPELLDPTSQLALEVDRRLRGMDDKYKRYNTRIVLNTAEDVAAEFGVKPRHSERARRVTRKPDSVGGNKPLKTKDDADFGDSVIPKEDFMKIAKRLESGKVKFDKAALARIAERGKLYKQHLSAKED